MRPAIFSRFDFGQGDSVKRTLLFRLLLLHAIILGGSATALAREGDTLEPIAIDAPTLVTWPENMLDEETDYRLINQRVNEARNAGVPLAVRIVDFSLPEDDIPFQIRQYAQEDFSQQLSPERQQEIVESWVRSEDIETREGANDGFLLLVLMPEDRTQTKAIWWIGPNALPLNGLTQENILATHRVMDEQFTQGNVANGVFLGISEFSYNIQFGTPERLERSTLQSALHMATIPMAVVTALAGISIPVLALLFSRRNNLGSAIAHDLSPWEAAALHLGRARSEIPAAMLMNAVHLGEITPLADGGIQLSQRASGAAIDALRLYADDDGIIDAATMVEIQAISEPIRHLIERDMMDIGAMTPNVASETVWMRIAMGTTIFLAALSVVPSIISMSAIGVLGMAIGIVGVAIGCWWLAYRRYTSPAGEVLLNDWLGSANETERSAFDLVVHQDLLTEPLGGPDVTAQTQLIRQLRGLSSA